MIEKLLTMLAGVIFAKLVDAWFMKKYDAPSLSILIVKCRDSKYLWWLGCDVWGDTDRYCDLVRKGMNKKIAH